MEMTLRFGVKWGPGADFETSALSLGEVFSVNRNFVPLVHLRWFVRKVQRDGMEAMI
jgi:hypothetical protein